MKWIPQAGQASGQNELQFIDMLSSKWHCLLQSCAQLFLNGGLGHLYIPAVADCLGQLIIWNKGSRASQSFLLMCKDFRASQLELIGPVTKDLASQLIAFEMSSEL